MKEEWKIYKETTHKRWGHRVYEVSNLGRVKVNGKIIKPGLHNHGKFNYYAIGCFDIHRAVAELYVPNPENKPCVDHINTDPLDNRACNLRWVTHKENSNNPLTKQHASEAQKGRTISEEAKLKLSEARKGKHHSEESKAKLSAAKRGRHWKLVDGKRIYYR